MNNKRNHAEFELLHLLEARGLPATRNLQQWVDGRENPDLALPGLHLEIKLVDVLCMSEVLDQAKSDAAELALPVMMTRRILRQNAAICRKVRLSAAICGCHTRALKGS